MMPIESTEKSEKISKKSCKEHADEEIEASAKTCLLNSASNQKKPEDDVQQYSMKKEKDATEDNEKCYIVSREDSIISGLHEYPIICPQYHDGYGFDEYCEKHAQGTDVSPQNTLDVIDECFSFATDIVSTAVDKCPDFNLFPTIIDFILKIVVFLKTNPKVTSLIAAFCMLWWIWCQIDNCYSYLIANIIHTLNPCVHSIAVGLEQLFRRGFQFSSSIQEVWESFYCDFSSNWCQKFELMCHVQCSHFHRTFERIRRTF